MREQVERLKEFHDAFNHTVNETPTEVDLETYKLRSLLMAEELDEYVKACKEGDLVGIADAIADQLVILLGTAVTHGMGDILEDLFNEVMDSNMSKLDENGRPVINGQNGVDIPDLPVGKILKSDRYNPPNLEKYIK